MRHALVRKVLMAAGFVIVLGAILFTSAIPFKQNGEGGWPPANKEGWTEESPELFWKLDLHPQRGIFLGDKIEAVLNIVYDSRKVSFSKESFAAEVTPSPYLFTFKAPRFTGRSGGWSQVSLPFVAQPILVVPGNKVPGFTTEFLISYRQGAKSRVLHAYMPSLVVSCLRCPDDPPYSDFNRFHTEQYPAYGPNIFGRAKTYGGLTLVFAGLVFLAIVFRKTRKLKMVVHIAPEIAELKTKVDAIRIRASSSSEKLQSLWFVLDDFTARHPQHKEKLADIFLSCDRAWAGETAPEACESVFAKLDKFMRGGQPC